MANKKATVEWTFGKLLSIILAIILLALIIYGFRSGGINPLVDWISAKMDGVRAMLPFWEKEGNATEDNCYTVPLLESSSGRKLIERLGHVGIDASKATFDVCTAGVCVLNNSKYWEGKKTLENGIWTFDNGRLMGGRGDGNVPSSQYLEGVIVGDRSLSEARLMWNVFNETVNFLDSVNVRDFLEAHTIPYTFMLRGVGGSDELSTATWRDGNWIIKGKEPFETSVDREAIIEFRRYVDDSLKNWIDALDDTVTYSISGGDLGDKWKDLDLEEYPLSLEVEGGSNNIDEDEDEILFLEAFRKLKESYLFPPAVSLEDKKSFASKINGGRINVLDEVYELYAAEMDGDPVVLLISNEHLFVLRFEFSPDTRLDDPIHDKNRYLELLKPDGEKVSIEDFDSLRSGSSGSGSGDLNFDGPVSALKTGDTLVSSALKYYDVLGIEPLDGGLINVSFLLVPALSGEKAIHVEMKLGDNVNQYGYRYYNDEAVENLLKNPLEVLNKYDWRAVDYGEDYRFIKEDFDYRYGVTSIYEFLKDC